MNQLSVVPSSPSGVSSRRTDQPRRATRPLPSPPPTILVAIADEQRRSNVNAAVSNLDCEVVTVADGYHLIQLIADAILDDTERPRPTLIIADSILPGCTGLSVLAGIRELGWNTPVVLLTGPDDATARQRAWELGVSGVFIEPFDVRELSAFCDLVLDPSISVTFGAARSPNAGWLATSPIPQ